MPRISPRKISSVSILKLHIHTFKIILIELLLKKIMLLHHTLPSTCTLWNPNFFPCAFIWCVLFYKHCALVHVAQCKCDTYWPWTKMCIVSKICRIEKSLHDCQMGSDRVYVCLGLCDMEICYRLILCWLTLYWWLGVSISLIPVWFHKSNAVCQTLWLMTVSSDKPTLLSFILFLMHLIIWK